MSYTAQPEAQRPTTNLYTVKVTAANIEPLTEETFERVVAEALAEYLDKLVTIDADELPF